MRDRDKSEHEKLQENNKIGINKIEEQKKNRQQQHISNINDIYKSIKAYTAF